MIAATASKQKGEPQGWKAQKAIAMAWTAMLGGTVNGKPNGH